MSDEVKIEFPCVYPLKVVGDAASDFLSRVMTIVSKHDPSITLDKIKEKKSRNGNYQSVTVLFYATSTEHVSAVYEDLMKCDLIRMVF
ncbi:MAG: DUF493 domain-containing protein [Gammaproteobacteria bacterium]|nr:DUF493 domain-containing protein [Gammaproteobacteria bacterium]